MLIGLLRENLPSVCLLNFLSQNDTFIKYEEQFSASLIHIDHFLVSKIHHNAMMYINEVSFKINFYTVSLKQRARLMVLFRKVI